MISQQLLDLLRCPLDRNSRLEQSDDGLVCQRCRLLYPVRDGIPCLVPEEAQLPPGCAALKALPCQQPAPPQQPNQQHQQGTPT